MFTYPPPGERLDAASRMERCDVIAKLDSQVAAAKVRRKGPHRSRRRALGNEHSSLAFVPALGVVHSPGTRAASLFRIVSFDVLHVRNLGISACWREGSRRCCILFASGVKERALARFPPR